VKPPSTAVNNTKYLLKNPANGGIPAIENKQITKVIANTGDVLDIVHNLEIWFSPFFQILNTHPNELIDIKIYKTEYKIVAWILANVATPIPNNINPI
jgi:hypothetical protein